MENHQPQSELDWLAFRYFLGELSDQDAAEFEACLAEDQQARESLEQCVHWVAAVKLAKPENTVKLAEPDNTVKLAEPNRVSGDSRSRRFLRHPAAWAAVVVAACLLLAALIGQTLDRNDAATSPELDALARAWSEAALIESADEQREVSLDEELESDNRVEADPLADDAESLAIPEWMIAAVRSDADSAAENEL